VIPKTLLKAISCQPYPLCLKSLFLSAEITDAAEMLKVLFSALSAVRCGFSETRIHNLTQNSGSYQQVREETVVAGERFPVSYFKKPFPAIAGFSPYRTPGMLVHSPVIGLFTWLSTVCCFERTWLTPFAAASVAAGVYLGRDAAIAANYNMFITLSVWAVCLAVIWNPWNVSAIVAAGIRESLVLQCTITLGVVLGFVLNIWLWRRRCS
jgi:hypothetical protein